MRFTIFIYFTATVFLSAADHFTGMVSCASSGCHGGGKGSDQCIIWRRGDPLTGKRDPHHLAADILSAARSKQIGQALNIPEPIKSSQCTTCHSPMESISEKRLVRDVKPDQGVSCEACHGAAEAWLRFHPRRDITHEQRVSAGLRDLDSAYARANTCVGCHTNINPKLTQAGHPELKFELTRQIDELPRHWVDSREFTAYGLWLTGQAAVLREWSWKLGKQPDEELLRRWRALRWLLKQTPAGDRTLPAGAQDSKFEETRTAADRLARTASKESASSDVGAKHLRAFAGLGKAFRGNAPDGPELKRRAESLLLALNALIPRDQSGKLAPAVEEKFRALQGLIKPGVPFESEKFAAGLDAFQSVL